MGIFIIIVVALALAGAVLFNRLTRYRFLVREAYSGVDVQLKRRHDLIPRIVEVVKGYSHYESGLLQEVTKLRSQTESGASAKERGEMESKLSQGLKDIFALAEGYPALKASENYLALQSSLIEVEDQIQLARRYYNGTVRDYNIAAESFPGNIVASLFHFQSAEFFELEYVTERQVPDVKF